MFSTIKVIAFDADDTLWVNEPYFRTAEKAFCELLKEYVPEEECNELLYKFEMQNLPLYGYGIKPFVLSLIEAAITISKKQIPLKIVSEIIAIGKEMLQMPVELIDGIEATLAHLSIRSACVEVLLAIIKASISLFLKASSILKTMALYLFARCSAAE